MASENFHESFAEQGSVEGPSNRKFGMTVGGVFAAIGLFKAVFFSFSWIAAMFAVLGCALVAAALFAPNRLSPFNDAWMKLALFLYKIVNPVIMFLIFSVAFVPMGLIMRLSGHDPMRRRFDKSLKSYWIEKERSPVDRPMKYQF